MAGGRIRYWGLLIPAVATQLAANHIFRGAASLTVLIAGYVILAGFLWANRLLVGSGIMAAGLAANAAVVLVNGGMPVRGSAIVAAGLAGRNGPAVAPTGARHHLQGAGDRLTFLDDHLALRPIHQVVSFGDVLLVVGAVIVLAHLVLEGWANATGAGRAQGDDPRPDAGVQPSEGPVAPRSERLAYPEVRLAGLGGAVERVADSG